MSADKSKSSKKPWTPEEDAKLLTLISDPGTYGSWPRIAKGMDNRTGKQCRERYLNQLNPGIKKGSWTKEEDELIIKLHTELGNKWCKYTPHIPGRSDNSIKNRWHVICRPDYSETSMLSFVTAQSHLDALLQKRIQDNANSAATAEPMKISATMSGSGDGTIGRGNGVTLSSSCSTATENSSSRESSPTPQPLHTRIQRISLDNRPLPQPHLTTAASNKNKAPTARSSGIISGSRSAVVVDPLDMRDPLDDLCDLCQFSDMTNSPSCNQSDQGSPVFFKLENSQQQQQKQQHELKQQQQPLFLQQEFPAQLPVASCSMDSYAFSIGSSSNYSSGAIISTSKHGRHHHQQQQHRIAGVSVCSSFDSEDEYGAPSAARQRFLIPSNQQPEFQQQYRSQQQLQQQQYQHQQFQLQQQQEAGGVYRHPQNSASFTTVATVNSTASSSSASSGHSLFSNLSTSSHNNNSPQTYSPHQQQQQQHLDAIEESFPLQDAVDLLSEDDDVDDMFEFLQQHSPTAASAVAASVAAAAANGARFETSSTAAAVAATAVHSCSSEEKRSVRPGAYEDDPAVQETFSVVQLCSDEAVDAVLDALVQEMPKCDLLLQQQQYQFQQLLSGDLEPSSATSAADIAAAVAAAENAGGDRNSAQIAAAAVELVERMAAQVHDPASHSQSNLKKLLAYDSFTLNGGTGVTAVDGIATVHSHTSTPSSAAAAVIAANNDYNSSCMKMVDGCESCESSPGKSEIIVIRNAQELTFDTATTSATTATAALLPEQQQQQQQQLPAAKKKQSRKGKLASAVERPSLRPFSGSFNNNSSSNGNSGGSNGFLERSPVAYTHLSPACPSSKRQCGFFTGSS